MMCGPCRVPLLAGIGTAKITLSYPGWKEGRVRSVTIEVPIEPMSWSGLFWGYLIWPMGAMAIAAIGGMFWRAWRYVARLRRALRP